MEQVLNTIISRKMQKKISSLSIREKISQVIDEHSDSYTISPFQQEINSLTIKTRKSSIKVKGFVTGLTGTLPIDVLIDTGANESLLEYSVAAEIGARMTGKRKRIHGVTNNFMDLHEAEVFVELVKGKDRVGGTILLSLMQDVTKITDGCVLLAGMDILAFERGKEVTLIIE